MVSVPVQCPYCHNTEIIKAGKQANGTQRYQCQNGQCERRIFLGQYQDRGRHAFYTKETFGRQEGYDEQ
jgi:transposase-like protein